MKIIALVGPSSCGKTSTLNLVYDDLLTIAQGGKSTNKQPQGGNPRDFSDIVLWQGKTIAFFTMGDYSKPLVNATRAYHSQQVDVLICACNLRLARPFYEFQNPIYVYHQINKSKSLIGSLRHTADALFAQTIYNLI